MYYFDDLVEFLIDLKELHAYTKATSTLAEDFEKDIDKKSLKGIQRLRERQVFERNEFQSALAKLDVYIREHEASLSNAMDVLGLINTELGME